MKSINCKGTLIDLSTPKVMGIMNITPDSFYDGGKISSEKEILNRAERLLNEGAAFLDIGGYSSRPDAAEVSEEEELRRVVPVISLVDRHFPEACISVDTFRSEVARQSVAAGACLINDISGGLLDHKMLETVAELQLPYILMHMKGTPQTMKELAVYEDVVSELLYYFSERVSRARTLGINDIIIDPGFGFAKTISHNFEILGKLELFQHLDVPLLVGLSRKSTIYKTLGVSPSEALNGTTALHSVALLKGASILRVHDVREAVECVKLLNEVRTAN